SLLPLCSFYDPLMLALTIQFGTVDCVVFFGRGLSDFAV
ncbi:MAG: hypothetical protein ACJASY_002697, partial [Halioglobus sp.]